MDCEIRAIEGVIGAFGKRGVEVIALSSQQETPPPAFRSRYVSRAYVSPTISEERAYLEFLLQLPHRGVLVYSSDAGAEFASKYREEIRRAGYLVNIPDIGTFRKAFNKDCIYKVCAECGVPTMQTREVAALEDVYAAQREIGLPLILKPTRLAGGRYRKIAKAEEIPAAYEEMTELVRSAEFAAQQSGLIVQEFVEHGYDDIYCCESYYGLRHPGRRFLSIRKIRPNINYDGTTGSRLHAGETIQSPELERHTERLLDHLNWTGFAHLDWLYSKKREKFLLCEINPRLPGFSNFITAVGFDMAWDYYTDLTGLPRAPFRYKRALYFEALRHPGDLTTNLLAVKNGYLKPGAYFGSYLKVLTLRYKVVFDVFYGSDPGLTWENYKISFRNLARKVKRS